MDITAIGSAIAGSALCAAVARYAIVGALADLRDVTHEINLITTKLAVIQVKLVALERLEKKIESHDTMLAEIKGKIRAKSI